MRITYDLDYLMNHRGPTMPFEKQDQALIDAGCSRYWNDPQTGRRVFEVEKMPQDDILYGIKWIEVERKE